MHRFRLLLLIFCLFPFTGTAENLPASPSTEKLSWVNNKIIELQKNLHQTEEEKTKLGESLKIAEISIGKHAMKIGEMEQAMEHKSRDLEQLRIQSKTDEDQIEKERRILVQQLKATFQLGQQGFIKILLNESDLNRMQRILTYFRYLNTARIKTVQTLQDNLENAVKTQIALTESIQLYRRLKEESQNQREALEIFKQQRSKILIELSSSIRNQNDQIEKLLQDKASLEHVMDQLQNHPTETTFANLPFQQLKGKLSWPSSAKLTLSFGMEIPHSHLHTNGVFLEAETGTPIYAIAPGKVVFSDWLSGYGLLIIIDHGSDYMTLYGHNQSLYKPVGTQIKAGELIATIGNSGGFQKTGLYFEIRYKGTPLNPQNWCKVQENKANM